MWLSQSTGSDTFPNVNLVIWVDIFCPDWISNSFWQSIFIEKRWQFYNVWNSFARVPRTIWIFQIWFSLGDVLLEIPRRFLEEPRSVDTVLWHGFEQTSSLSVLRRSGLKFQVEWNKFKVEDGIIKNAEMIMNFNISIFRISIIWIWDKINSKFYLYKSRSQDG